MAFEFSRRCVAWRHLVAKFHQKPIKTKFCVSTLPAKDSEIRKLVEMS